MVYDLSILEAMLEEDYNALKYFDWDSLTCITGNEGTGKSKLQLICLTIWLKIQGIEITENNAEDILKRSVGVKFIQWCDVLRNTEKAGFNSFDEAGDLLTGKHAGSKSVRIVEDSYTVIRGLNLLSFLLLPSIFDLSPFFRNRRVKNLFYVERRGLCHVWHFPKKNIIMAKNENKQVKNLFIEDPLFSFKFPDYNGPLLKPYLKLKNEKMHSVLKNMYDQVQKIESA